MDQMLITGIETLVKKVKVSAYLSQDADTALSNNLT